MRITSSAIKVLLCLCLFALPAAAQQKASTLKLKPYTFENAKGEKVDSEFGTLLVPEKRSNPESNLIELAFVRFKSTAKNPGPPIVYLAGGPGGSGIGTATGSRFPLFMALREIGDVIAFDQRGTGYSNPISAVTNVSRCRSTSRPHAQWRWRSCARMRAAASTIGATFSAST